MIYLRKIPLLICLIASRLGFACQETKHQAELGSYNTQMSRSGQKLELLHEAAMRGDEVMVATLLRCGANINAENVHYFTPLQLAASKEHEGVVGLLLAHKESNPDVQSLDGSTAFQIAAKAGYIDIARAIYDAGGKVDIEDLYGGTVYKDVLKDITIVKAHRKAFLAIENDDINMVKALLELKKISALNIEINRAAIKKGNVALVKLLHKHGADFNNGEMADAARERHYDIVKFLLDIGCPVNNDSRTLINAIENNHEEMVQLLLKYGADVNYCGSLSPLGLAVIKGNAKIVALLLNYKPVLENNYFRKQPLVEAVRQNRQDIVSLLLDHGAKVDAQELRHEEWHDSETALAMAAELGNCSLIELLLSRKAEIDFKGQSGISALSAAALGGQEEAFMLLLKHNASMKCTDSDGTSMLYYALLGGSEKIIQHCRASGVSLPSYNEIRKLLAALMKKRDDVHMLKYILHTFLSKDEAELIVRDRINVLHEAARFGRLESVKYLAERYPQLLTTGRSVLLVAIENYTFGGHELFSYADHKVRCQAVVKYLVEKYPELVDKHADSLLDSALGSFEILKLLLQQKNIVKTITSCSPFTDKKTWQLLWDHNVAFNLENGICVTGVLILFLLKKGVDISKLPLDIVLHLDDRRLAYLLDSVIEGTQWARPEAIAKINKKIDKSYPNSRERISKFFKAIKQNDLQQVKELIDQIDCFDFYDNERSKTLSAKKDASLITLNTPLHIAIEKYNDYKKENNNAALQVSKAIISEICQACPGLWEARNVEGITPADLLVKYDIAYDFVKTYVGIFDKARLLSSTIQHFLTVRETLDTYEIPHDVTNSVIRPYLEDSSDNFATQTSSVDSSKASLSASSSSAAASLSSSTENSETKSEVSSCAEVSAVTRHLGKRKYDQISDWRRGEIDAEEPPVKKYKLEDDKKK